MMGWDLAVMQSLGITPIPVSSFSPVLCAGKPANSLVPLRWTFQAPHLSRLIRRLLASTPQLLHGLTIVLGPPLPAPSPLP